MSDPLFATEPEAGAGAGAGAGDAAPAPAAAEAEPAAAAAPEVATAAADAGDESKAEPALAARTSAHFILSAPPGRVADAVKELAAILPADALTGGDREKVFYKFNTKNLVAVPVPYGEHKVVLCSEAERDPAHFIDSIAGKVVHVNHQDRTTSGEAEDVVFEQAAEPHRAALVAAVAEYCDKFYGDGGACGVFHADDGSLSVVIVAQIVNARNQWSGSWQSRWKVVVGEGSVSVSGTATFAAQYSEFGNVQLDNKRDVPAKSAPFTDSASLAKEVTKIIRVAESNLGTRITGAMVETATSTLKSVRRRLPINGQTMNWNVKAHRMNRHFGGKSLS